MVDIPGRVVQPALERRDAVTAQILSVKSVPSVVKRRPLWDLRALLFKWFFIPHLRQSHP